MGSGGVCVVGSGGCGGQWGSVRWVVGCVCGG